MKYILNTPRIFKWACALMLILAGYTSGAQTKIKNFSGTWLLNEDKCDFGRLTAASASKIKTLTIVQSDEQITIKSGDSLANSSVVLNLNGKPSEQTTVSVINDIPNTSKKYISLQIVNSQSFISTIKDPVSMPSSSIKAYTISNNGQLLTIDYNNTYGEQVLAGKLVYDKKKD